MNGRGEIVFPTTLWEDRLVDGLKIIGGGILAGAGIVGLAWLLAEVFTHGQ